MGFEPEGLFVQPAASGLEIVVASSPERSPTRREKRSAGRVSPVLLVIGYPAKERHSDCSVRSGGQQPVVMVISVVSQIG